MHSVKRHNSSWLALPLGDDELASGDWREAEVLFPLWSSSHVVMWAIITELY
jgi:hypothetical protein